MKKNLTFLSLLLSVNLYSQSYTELPETGLENKSLSSVAVGDLNNDGYEDIVTTGIDENFELSTSVYSNNGDGTFTKLDAGLTPMYNANIVLGDYNNDGFLDILLSGEGYDPVSTLWKNNGDLSFTEIDAGLANIGGKNAEFGDIDNDGDLDVLLAGQMKNENGSYMDAIGLYINEGNDTFSESSLTFSGGESTGSLADFDNDGDLDIVVGGSLKIYPNNGDGSFNSPVYIDLSFSSGQIEWFDYDNDQYLDLLIVDNSATTLLRNNQDNTFSALEGSFATLARGNVDLRDYNSDGTIDILLTGTEDFGDNTFITNIYDNAGSAFTQNINVSIPQLGSGDGSWFDVDNDGDLDLLIIGEEVQGSTVRRTVLLQNDANDNVYAANSIPSAPSNLGWTSDNDQVVFSWDVAADAETPAAELSYNVGVGSTSDATDILYPEAANDGKRLIHSLGNAQNNKQKNIKGLEDGIYYFKVQSLDGALAGSQFSAAEKFAIGIPEAAGNAAVSIDENSEVEITWSDNSINEFYFIIEQKSNINNEYIVIDSALTNETSLSLSGLEDAIYSFRIKASNPNGESDYIETDDIAVGIPLAPSNPQATFISDGEVELSWTDNSSNEFSFVIEKKSNLNSEYIEAGNAAADDLSYSITNLENAIYTFRLKAINPNGESEYIETAVVPVGLPAPPSAAQASITSDNEVNISWTDNSANEYYFVIEQSSNLNEAYIVVDSVAEDVTSFTVQGLEDAIYTFRVKALNPNGDSDYLEPEDIAIGVPTAPTTFTLEDLDGVISLAWEDLVNERSFVLERSADNGATYESLATLERNTLEYRDEIEKSGDYSYRIQAVNENGVSEYTETKVASVLGIAEFLRENISVYPNPIAKNHLYVRLSDQLSSSKITMHDFNGKRITAPRTFMNNTWEINTAKIPSGIYMLLIEVEGNVYARKVIIQ